MKIYSVKYGESFTYPEPSSRVHRILLVAMENVLSLPIYLTDQLE